MALWIRCVEFLHQDAHAVSTDRGILQQWSQNRSAEAFGAFLYSLCFAASRVFVAAAKDGFSICFRGLTLKELFLLRAIELIHLRNVDYRLISCHVEHRSAQPEMDLAL